jgi:hypothetical protein
MVEQTILQNELFLRFVLPFLVVFFLVFAILEKTKIFGEGKKQLNALLAFVIGLLFVAFAYPTEIVSNLILFLTVAVVIVFVVLLLYGFIVGSENKIFPDNNFVKIAAAIVVFIAVIVAVLWAMGIENEIFTFLFYQAWSESFWVNAIFIIVIAAALAFMLKTAKGK